MNTKNITTVELFAGIGGFRLAADAIGIKTVWANDIDDNACNVYIDKFGDKELAKGDINTLIDEVPAHDLLTGGFPCQPFSSAGKKRGIQDPRGTLFEAIIKILKKRQPKYFVLENVKRLLEMDGGKHFATILSALSELDYLIEWRLINTMYFGLPQNRPRVVIVGKLRKVNGGTAGKEAILITEEEGKELISKNKSLFAENSDWKNISEHGKSFPNWGIAFNGKFYGHSFKGFAEAKPLIKVKSVLQKNVGEVFFYTEDTLKRIENSVLVDRLINGIHVMYNQKGGARMGYTIFATEGLAPTLTCTTSRHYERYKIGDAYRILTNVEYARIQGFPDEHCSAVSVYKQYKLFGNAIAPNMVSWVLKKLFIDIPVKIEIT